MNATDQRKKESTADCKMHPRNFSGGVRLLSIERMTFSSNSSDPKKVSLAYQQGLWGTFRCICQTPVARELIGRLYRQSPVSDTRRVLLKETRYVPLGDEVSNPAFSPNALTPADAVSLLRVNLGHPALRFCADDIDFLRAVEPFAERIVGHQQVSDANLPGLAIRRKGKLATLAF